MVTQTKPKQILYSPVDVDDAEFESFGAEKTEEEIDFERFRDEMRESNEYAKITVYRQPTTHDNRPGQKKLVFLFECGVDEFTFSQICGKLRDEYGSGTYRIQARDEKSKMQMNRAIQIEAPKREYEPGQPAPGTSAGDIIDRFSIAMNDNTERTERMLARMMPQTNPMGMLTEMATAMATIMSKFQAQQAPQKTLMEQLTEFKMLQELFSGDKDGSGGEANLFSLLTETVRSFGPALGMAIAAQKNAGAIPATGPIQALLPNPNEGEKETVSNQLKSMKPQIDFLVSQAKMGADPQAVVEAIFPGIPEQALESIEAFLQQDNCIELCAQVNGEVNNLRAWFMQWRETMLEKINDFFLPDDDAGEVSDAQVDDEVIGPAAVPRDVPPASIPRDAGALTNDDQAAQNRDAVAGEATDKPVRATAKSRGKSGNIKGAAKRGGRNARDS